MVPNCKYTSLWLQFDRPFHDSIRYHRHSCLTVNKSRTNEMSGLIELHVCAVIIAAACFCCLTKHSRLFSGLYCMDVGMYYTYQDRILLYKLLDPIQYKVINGNEIISHLHNLYWKSGGAH